MQRLHLKRRSIGAFLSDNKAVAAVEFALVVPLLLALYLGAVEGSDLYTADRKVAMVASSMADLVSRERGKIERSSLNDYFTAAASILQPMSANGLGQVVTFIKVDKDGKATVRWSSASGTGAAREVGSPFPLAATTEISQLARNAKGWVVAAEVHYPYQPLVGYIINKTFDIGHIEYFLPRFQEEILLGTGT